ncbi:hypothetical protein AN640_02835 [Candidatus Epulonipiscium fishelsonii]|uniref:Uncharacterized protein n=1 Tax=Candidatus Epulonipiscium fishelsonii TaxID=77094 RepID=A0ACC8X8P3_9FIRM|nr:hypothetical protein AN640_02835 [Epulopiscium sp. SCG-D08WGA-EpuloA1]
MLSSEIRDNELRWLKKGREEGRLEGLEQGRLESIEQIAINLLIILDNNEIVEATQLTLDEVIALRNKYN